jgi:dihydrofolate reductase
VHIEKDTRNMTDTFKVTIHMVSSLDGIIAKKDNSVSWFETNDHYEQGVNEVSEQEAAAFLRSIDCYVMGSKTYEHALELSKSYGWIYGDVPGITVTQKKFPAILNVHFIHFLSGAKL